MRAKPWYCIPLINTGGERKTFATRAEAELWASQNSTKDESYDVQYRPGRR